MDFILKIPLTEMELDLLFNSIDAEKSRIKTQSLLLEDICEDLRKGNMIKLEKLSLLKNKILGCMEVLSDRLELDSIFTGDRLEIEIHKFNIKNRLYL